MYLSAVRCPSKFIDSSYAWRYSGVLNSTIILIGDRANLNLTNEWCKTEALKKVSDRKEFCHIFSEIGVTPDFFKEMTWIYKYSDGNLILDSKLNHL